jgi:hypothetical protein
MSERSSFAIALGVPAGYQARSSSYAAKELRLASAPLIKLVSRFVLLHNASHKAQLALPELLR